MTGDPNSPRLWPPERDRKLERYPRDRWASHPSLDVAFWLEVHSRFRIQCAELIALTDEYRQQRLPLRELAIVATPRVAGLLTDLRGHHQIEDHHYFPVFRRLVPTLGEGIDVLERDHAELDRDSFALGNAERELRAVAVGGGSGTGPATATIAGRRFVAAANTLCTHILRHLADEEDLVVPLLIEQTPS